ncbi:MAG: hypothetical protein IKJ28_06655 [Alphaproteobacteria bacterium]|nr:hypothetical protein [Alphaproteobacteria bacterium]
MTDSNEVARNSYKKVCEAVIALRSSGIPNVKVIENGAGDFVVQFPEGQLDTNPQLKELAESLINAQTEYQKGERLDETVRREIMNTVQQEHNSAQKQETAKEKYTKVCQLVVDLRNSGIEGVTVEEEKGKFVVKQNGTVVDVNALAEDNVLRQKVEALNAAQAEYEKTGIQLADNVKAEIMNAVQQEYEATRQQETAKEKYTKVCQLVMDLRNSGIDGVTVEEEKGKFVVKQNGTVVDVNALAADNALRQKIEALNTAQAEYEQLSVQLADDLKVKILGAVEKYTAVCEAAIALTLMEGITIESNEGQFVVKRNGEIIVVNQLNASDPLRVKIESFNAAQRAYQENGYSLDDTSKAEIKNVVQSRSNENQRKANALYADIQYIASYINTKEGFEASVSTNGVLTVKGKNGETISVENLVSENLISQEALNSLQEKSAELAKLGVMPTNTEQIAKEQIGRVKTDKETYDKVLQNRFYIQKLTGYEIQEKDGQFFAVKDEKQIPLKDFKHEAIEPQIIQDLCAGYDSYKRIGTVISEQDKKQVDEVTQSKMYDELIYNIVYLEMLTDYELVLGDNTAVNNKDPEEELKLDEFRKTLPEGMQEKLDVVRKYYELFQSINDADKKKQVSDVKIKLKEDVLAAYKTAQYNVAYLEALGYQVDLDAGKVTQNGAEISLEPKLQQKLDETRDAWNLFNYVDEGLQKKLNISKEELDQIKLTQCDKAKQDVNAERNGRSIPSEEAGIKALEQAAFVQNCISILTGYSISPIVNENGDISGWSVKGAEGTERVLADANAVLQDEVLREKVPTASLNALVTLYSEVANERKTVGMPLTQEQINEAVRTQLSIAEQSVQNAKVARSKIEYVRAYIKEKHQIDLITQRDETTGEIKWGYLTTTEGEQQMFVSLEEMASQNLITAEQMVALTENTTYLQELGVELDSVTVQNIIQEQARLAHDAVLREQTENNPALADAFKKATIVHNGLQILTGWSIMPVVENGQITGWAIKDAEGREKTEADLNGIMPEANVQKLKTLYADVVHIAQEAGTPVTADMIQQELPATQQDAQRSVETLKTSYQLMSYTQALVKKKAQIDLTFTVDGITAKKADGTDVSLDELVAGGILTAEELASLQRNHVTYYAQGFELDNKTAEKIKAEQIHRVNDADKENQDDEHSDDEHKGDDAKGDDEGNNEEDHKVETPEQRAARRRLELMKKPHRTSQEEKELERLNNERRRALEKRLAEEGELPLQEMQELTWLQQRDAAQQLPKSPATPKGIPTYSGGSRGGGSGGGTTVSGKPTDSTTLSEDDKNKLASAVVEGEQKGFWARNWEWIVGAVAAVAVAIGAFFLIRKQKKKTDKAKDEVKTLTGQVSDLQNKVNELSNGNSENSASSALANSGTAVNVDSLSDDKSARQLIYDSQTKSM